MEKILSVIVPAYNVEQYIGTCLESFAKIRLRELLEVVVVDDGSTDRTGQVAAAYCKRYPELFRLVSQENGGHGSAVNCGIRQLCGKYFHVVDSDDWVNSEEMDGFLTFLQNIDADIVANDFLCVQDETYRVLDKRFCMREPSLCRKVMKFEEVAERIPLIRIHSMTVRTGLYREHQIELDSYRYYVDFEYTLFPIPYVNTVAFYDSFLCMYRLGRTGQSVNIENMQKNRENHMLVIKRLLECYDKNREMPDEKRHYTEMGISKIVENQFQIYISMARKPGIFEEMKAFDRQLKQDYPEIYRAVSKKSIWMLRYTAYSIFPLAYAAYRIVKR